MQPAKAAQRDYTQLMLMMYYESMQQWKKSYESSGQAAQNRNVPVKPLGAAAEASSIAQNFALQISRRVVEGQVGLCRFFAHRWSTYRSLPDAVMACRTPLDLLPLQASFVKQLVEDYANESTRMMLAYFPWGQQAR